MLISDSSKEEGGLKSDLKDRLHLMGLRGEGGKANLRALISPQ